MPELNEDLEEGSELPTAALQQLGEWSLRQENSLLLADAQLAGSVQLLNGELSQNGHQLPFKLTGSLGDQTEIVCDPPAIKIDWQQEALCAQVDNEMFFPEKGGSTKEAKIVCGHCDVAALCLKYALSKNERFGVWGGLSERERRIIQFSQLEGAAFEERLSQVSKLVTERYGSGSDEDMLGVIKLLMRVNGDPADEDGEDYGAELPQLAAHSIASN
jgi:WhiB family redox-sensing transcriptional regulator